MVAIKRVVQWGLIAGVVLLGACQSAPPVTHGLNPEQMAVLRQQGFVETDEGWSLGISDKVLFETDADALNADSVGNIGRLGKSLMAVGIAHLRVLGYTDSSGNDSYNDALSSRRAAAVAEALRRAGVPESNIEQRGMGKRNPVADNRTAEGRTQNRRVAIIVQAE